MKRFVVWFEDRVFAEFVWAENKRQARKQMKGLGKIIKIED